MARHYSRDHRDTYRLREASKRDRSQTSRSPCRQGRGSMIYAS